MSDIICGATFPLQLLKLLQKMGLPEHVTSFKLACEGNNEPVTIDCTFMAYEKDRPILDASGFFETDSKQYRLIEVKE